MTSAYPELPLIENPKSNLISLEKSVHVLLSLTDDICLAKAVFAVMYAEASRTSDRNSFRSAGNYNYSGVQTDGSRWGYSDPIVNRYRRVDSGNKYREFAGFKNDAGFFDFMLNRIKAKGFNGCNADEWTYTYINKWWSPAAKAQYTKGTEKYNSKKNIFLGASSRFDKFKLTYPGKSIKKKFLNKKNIKLFGIPAIFLGMLYYLHKEKYI